MFSENPKVMSAELVPGVHALVVDNALADPDALVQFAVRTQSAFKPAAPLLFPGVELRLAESVAVKYEEFFRLHLRRYFDARRSIECVARLAMQTKTANELRAAQWMPQRIGITLPREQSSISCVLYLFENEAHGGTGFYLPRKSIRDTATMLRDSRVLSDEEFTKRYRIESGYCTRSNGFFQLAKVVPPRYNRLVVFDGAMFHGEQILRPELLTNDPRTGRLTFSAFLNCRRHSDGIANRRAR